MTIRRFSLQPFPGDRPGPDLRIAGSISRNAGTLALACSLLGRIAEISLPPPASAPLRKDLLWRDTCVELFLGVKGSKGYREFNLSPAGHWNVYRFDGYREGMREEPGIESLPFGVRIEADRLDLSLTLVAGKLFRAEDTVEAGVAAVVNTAGGGTIRWALVHPAPRPDFHRRENFILELPPGRYRP